MCAPTGRWSAPLDLGALEAELRSARAAGIDAVAIVFMHAYAHPEHERQAAELARALGFAQVSASHEVSPLIKLVPRGDTTVADAYLSPVLRRYVDRVSGALTSGAGDPNLLFMASSGGLKAAQTFRGRDAILSGPAGGVVGMAETASAPASTASSASTWAARRPTSRTSPASTSARSRRRSPACASPCRCCACIPWRRAAARSSSSTARASASGPDSAGANPGPTAYRRGGPLTVTDANVMLGKLDARFFPQIFGAGHDQPLDADAVRAAFADLAREVGDGRAPEEIADGCDPHRRREHGQRHQEDLGRARLRRDASTRSTASARPAGSTPA